MKFLLVGTNKESNGAATHFVALAEALVGEGHEVDVIASRGSLIAQELATVGVRLHEGYFCNAIDVRGYARVIAITRRCRPDWLMTNFGKEYWPLVIIGRLLGVPVALFRHRMPPLKRVSSWLLPRLARHFFAVSDYARQAYQGQGVAAGRVKVLYNPVNVSRCRPDPAKGRAIVQDLGIGEDAIVLGYAGRINAGKGVFVLLEAATAAMAREPRLHCLWIGDGRDAAALQERAADGPMADRHHFLGWTNDVHPYYSAMSMLGFPSLKAETFGRVSVEAQATGVPVLASRLAGIPETLMPEVTGLLLPPGDVAAWRDAILKMCDAPTRQRMGAAARSFVLQNFSASVIVAELVRIFREG